MLARHSKIAGKKHSKLMNLTVFIVNISGQQDINRQRMES